MLGQCKSTEEGAVHSLPGVESTEEAMLEVGLAVLGGGVGRGGLTGISTSNKMAFQEG